MSNLNSSTTAAKNPSSETSNGANNRDNNNNNKDSVVVMDKMDDPINERHELLPRDLINPKQLENRVIPDPNSNIQNTTNLGVSLPNKNLHKKVTKKGTVTTTTATSTTIRNNTTGRTSSNGSSKKRKSKKTCFYQDCNKLAAKFVGDCNFCNGHFCSTHRLMESHECKGLETCRAQSHQRNADKLNKEHTVVPKIQI